MKRRSLGPFQVSAIGFGCMTLSHGYVGVLEPAEGAKVLHRALDLGHTLLDTAALYGFGRNETLIGEALQTRRGEYVLASKCGIFRNDEGRREINGRPQQLRRTCEEALVRLKTEVIDLYYLHRLDPDVPVEESIGAMGELVAEGKVRTLGLSEASAVTLRRAHREHPITAMQSEYSLWTRNPEVAVLDACRELGVAFVAFSPLARGFLAGALPSAAALQEGDVRKGMPRFQGENFERNLTLLARFRQEADQAGCTPAQLCLAWLMHRDEIIIPIPGTRRLDHLEENIGAEGVGLSAEQMARLDEIINARTVAGLRYAPSNQAEIDTELLPQEDGMYTK
jgi:aryl-alcohol dehydrogenase-like predicted oxidoreductase